MSQSEIYVSTDVEADGKIPGVSSMLSFGSAAYTADKVLVSTFAANLHQLPDAEPDPETMRWWQTQPEAWAACRANPEEPATAMKRYYDWLVTLELKPVFVGYPAAYDFMWVYWYKILIELGLEVEASNVGKISHEVGWEARTTSTIPLGSPLLPTGSCLAY